MKISMGSHLTNAAKLSNDWGPPLIAGTKWSTKRYLNMKLLKEQKMVA